MKIIIIGAGPGGYETALEAAKREIEVILIEAGPLGGTCLNEGCIPTKTYCRSAQVAEDMRHASEFGVCMSGTETADVTAEPLVDLVKVKTRKDKVVQQLRSGIETLMKNKYIALVRGMASLKDAHTVRVVLAADSGESVSAADAATNQVKEYTADYIIIATGSSAAVPKFQGAELALTSREMLELTVVPKRLCVIGAGVIGLEFASIFRSFGSEVTVLEYFDGILPRYDSDLAKRLRLSLKKRGINIVTSAAVQSVARRSANGRSASDLYIVTYQYKGREETAETDCVLCAVGRTPRVDGLNLEAAGVEFDGRKIVTDENMRTTCPSVYAIGDVNGRMMLAHAATYQGLKALNHICGVEDRIDLSIMPSAVFTMPEAAAVGLTEDECTALGIAYQCHKSFFRANGKAVAMGETDGFVKLITYSVSEQVMEIESKPEAEKAVTYTDGQIIGCHLFGPHAADIVSEVTALMNKRTTLADLRDIIHAHPTLSEILSF